MGVTVRQKKKGKGHPWWVFVSHNGKRTSKQVGDKGAAEIVASTIRAKLKLGDFDFEPEKPVPTFKEYAESFLEGFSKINHKPTTHGFYKSALNNHIYPVFGAKPIDTIRRPDIKNFLTQKQTENLSSASVKNIKAYMSCILNQAVDDEIIASNPATRTGNVIKKNDSKEVKPFTKEEKELFEQTTKAYFPRFYPFFLTALRTGLRIGEIIALKPEDLDFNNTGLNQQDFKDLSLIIKTNGLSKISSCTDSPRTNIITVAAAASVPSSFTSTNEL